jgi:hypothetical protein
MTIWSPVASVSILVFASTCFLEAGTYTCGRAFTGALNGNYTPAINDSGQVIEYQSGTVTSVFLDNPDGSRIPIRNGSVDINNRGEIVGSAENAGVFAGFLRHADGSYSNIEPPSGTDPSTYFAVTGINDSDYTAGLLGTGSSAQVFLRDPAGKYTLIPFPYATFLVRINNALQLVVNTQFPNSAGHAYLVATDGSREEIDFPGLPGASLTGLNNLGWTSGTVFNPGLDSRYAVSDLGFVRDANGVYHPVVCSDRFIQGATDINTKGDVLAAFFSQTDEISYTVATPMKETPSLTLSFTDWGFAAHPVGSPSGVGTIYLTNDGSTVRTLYGYYPDVEGDMDFFLSTNCGSIQPGQSCALDFTFLPGAVGARTSTYYLITDDPQGLMKITLHGSGSGKSLQISATSWTFAAHPVGVTSGPGNIWIYNNGTGPVTFGSTLFTGPDAKDFTLQNECAAVLLPYKTCQLQFFITPGGRGSRTAILTINSDAMNSPQTLPVAGTGL